MKTNIKTIDIQALEWLDKVNGNSYFSGIIIVNYGMKTAKTLKMDFKYGNGDQYIWEALSQLKKSGFILNECDSIGEFCDKNKVILRSDIKRGCLKRDVVSFARVLELFQNDKQVLESVFR